MGISEKLFFVGLNVCYEHRNEKFILNDMVWREKKTKLYEILEFKKKEFYYFISNLLFDRNYYYLHPNFD